MVLLVVVSREWWPVMVRRDIKRCLNDCCHCLQLLLCGRRRIRDTAEGEENAYGVGEKEVVEDPTSEKCSCCY